jgi:hypothetical protein
MKRYDKDGNEVKNPDCLKNLEWSCDCSDVGMQICLNKKSEFEKASTPQQMAERIKELEREKESWKIDSIGETEKLKESQQEVKEWKIKCQARKYQALLAEQENQRLREGVIQSLKDKLKSYDGATDYYLERCATRDCITLVEQILQTKQNKEG